VAGALRQTVSGTKSHGGNQSQNTAAIPPAMPMLEAMGSAAISRTVNAIALCNRMLDTQGTTGTLRLSFVPSVNLFVNRASGEDSPENWASKKDETDAIRRSMKFQLRLVHQPLFASASPDVIRVAVKTNPMRLSGLVSSRMRLVESGASNELVIIQAMGQKSIDTMIKALAFSWQSNSREFVGDSQEVGFTCYPSHMALEDTSNDDGSEQPTSSRRLYSGVQCQLLPPSHQ